MSPCDFRCDSPVSVQKPFFLVVSSLHDSSDWFVPACQISSFGFFGTEASISENCVHEFLWILVNSGISCTSLSFFLAFSLESWFLRDEDLFKSNFCTESLEAWAATRTAHIVLVFFRGRFFPKNSILYRKQVPGQWMKRMSHSLRTSHGQNWI